MGQTRPSWPLQMSADLGKQPSRSPVQRWKLRELPGAEEGRPNAGCGLHTVRASQESFQKSSLQKCCPNIYQLKVLDCAMDACINLGLLEEALFYGIRTMEPYR